MKFALVSSALLLLLVFLPISLLLLLLRHPAKLNLPPRPSQLRLPLLGDILHLLHLQKSPASLQCLQDELGPIFTLCVGSTPIIFITSASLVYEALVEKGRIFAARPKLPSRDFFTNYRNITTASYGPYWRTMRRNLAQEMLTIPRILLFRSTRTRVVDNLVSHIHAEARQNAGVVSVYSHLRTAMFELLLFMCFGFDMPKDALQETSALLDEYLKWVSMGSLADFYPFLKPFQRKRQRIEHALKERQVRHFTSHIQKHQELDKLGQLAEGSYLGTLLHMGAADGMMLSDADLVVLCTEFILAAIDTTRTALEWAMAHLVSDGHIQSKLYNQICDVVGDRVVEHADLPLLPYLQAILKEALRLHPPLHILLPHAVSEPCKVGGYDIPTSAVV